MKEILTERQNLFEPNVYITMCVELTGKAVDSMIVRALSSNVSNLLSICLRREVFLICFSENMYWSAEMSNIVISSTN